MRQSSKITKQKQSNQFHQMIEQQQVSTPSSIPKKQELKISNQLTPQYKQKMTSIQEQSLRESVKSGLDVKQTQKQTIKQVLGTNESKEHYNSNRQVNCFTITIYAGLVVYLYYFLYLLLPAMKQVFETNLATKVALIIALSIDYLLIFISYEKARKISPGYPVKLQEKYRVRNEIEALRLPEIQQIKSKTNQLLIRKAQLKESYEKNRTNENLQKLESFELQFFAKHIKYCQKCKNIKQVRVRHCSQCKRCIMRMDHHCVWLNNCVGKNNHKFFMLFLLYLLIALTLFCVIGLIDVCSKDQQLSQYIQEKYGMGFKIVHLVLWILSVVLWLYYMFVFCQQLYLIANNLTFVQSLSKILSEKKPWKRNSFSDNFREVFGAGCCWILPTEVNHRYDFILKEQQNKKNPSVELVQEILVGNTGDNLTNFDSQNQIKHERNQI